MRIAFVKDWHDEPEHLAGNKDGILAAVDILTKRHHVDFFHRNNWEGRPPQDNYDVLLCWGSLDRPWHGQLPKNIPALLCFAGGPTDHPFLANFQHVFVESKVYEDAFRSQGVSVSRAFGTNEQLFRPEPRTPKVFDAIYPASFCFHKNQELFARALGSRGLCVGPQNEEAIVGRCLQLGTPVLGRVSSKTLCDLFNMASCTVIPNGPNGGSQRTVLESLACNVPVVCADDNDKCREFIEESGFGLIVPPIAEAIREAVAEVMHTAWTPRGRDYILSKWTSTHYADALEQGILKVTRST